MSITYAPTTNFGLKDSLPTNDSDKVIRGSEFTTEFTAIQTAFSLAAPNASPTFTGTVTIPTADINGGAIDGTVIGGATPAAGSFTTGQFDTSLNVDGTVTADGLTVDGDGTLQTSDGAILNLKSTDTTLETGNVVGSVTFETADSSSAGIAAKIDALAENSVGGVGLNFYSGFGGSPVKRMTLDRNGDISFYEDTGTTPKFFWDASAEALGIGNSAPTDDLHVGSSSGGTQLKIESGAATNCALIYETGGVDSWRIGMNLSGPTGSLQFYDDIANTTRMLIDSSGNVGIGTSSPDFKLSLSGGMRIEDLSVSPDSGSGTEYGYNTVSNAGFQITRTKGVGTSTYRPFIHRAEYITFDTGTSSTTERMRIDSSGNLLVGMTSYAASSVGTTMQSGLLTSARDGNITGYFNRLSSDGSIVAFAKDGSTVGSIGAASGYLYIHGTLASGGAGLGLGASIIYPSDGSGSAEDNTTDLGLSGGRFQDIYATNGTIQTSDANEKQDIAELDEAERRVAVAAKNLLRKFRWKDSVAEKGDDARIHFGIIAQDLQAAFEAEGLDAGRYAMFIHSTWTDEETGEERSRMGVRYSELLAFIIAAL